MPRFPYVTSRDSDRRTRAAAGTAAAEERRLSAVNEYVSLRLLEFTLPLLARCQDSELTAIELTGGGVIGGWSIGGVSVSTDTGHESFTGSRGTPVRVLLGEDHRLYAAKMVVRDDGSARVGVSVAVAQKNRHAQPVRAHIEQLERTGVAAPVMRDYGSAVESVLQDPDAIRISINGVLYATGQRILSGQMDEFRP